MWRPSRRPPLRPDERILWRRVVSLGPSSGSPDLRIGAGGWLFVRTHGRVIFLASRGNRKAVRYIREWSIDDIADVGVQERDWTAYAGGIQKRLRLTLRNGNELLFVVRKRERVVAELRELFASERSR
jgi:hypothetical protein